MAAKGAWVLEFLRSTGLFGRPEEEGDMEVGGT